MLLDVGDVFGHWLHCLVGPGETLDLRHRGADGHRGVECDRRDIVYKYIPRDSKRSEGSGSLL